MGPTAPLWWGYLALALGLMGAGALAVWLSVRRPRRPAGLLARGLLVLLGATALAGAIAVAVLEARAVRPW